MTTSPADATVPVRRPRPRIRGLDALRGFALCGILVSNIANSILHMQHIDPGPHVPLVPELLHSIVHQRFFPIFSLLFGVSFCFVLEGAGNRASRPRLVLVRRLVFLLLLGIGHSFLQPGEALSVYAAAGLVLLLPASWLPAWAVLALGFAVLAVNPSGQIASAGCLLIGCAVGRFGVLDTLERRGRQLAAVLAIGAAVTAVALPMQLSDPLNSGFNTSSAVAGLGTALVYVAGFLLLLRTPLGSVLSRVFEPLGRMALTHYVSATLLVLLADQLLALDGSRKWGVMFALAAGIAVVQWVFSWLWLRRFRYGPLEWCWRCVTWWRYVPNRRMAA